MQFMIESHRGLRPSPGIMSDNAGLNPNAGTPEGVGSITRPRRPSLLYISAVCPSTTGSGTPMRAGAVLEALSENYHISLLVAPASDYNIFDRKLPASLRKLCDDAVVVPPKGDLHYRIQESSDIYRDQRFDIVHVFRLAAIPFARPYLNRTHRIGTRHHLDLDDIESKTHRRIAELYREAGNAAMTAEEEEKARRLELLETVAFRIFDRIYVCSEADRRDLLNRACRAEVSVLRNVVRLPPRVLGSVFRFRFLFIGTLQYYPNEDAVRYFCARILPLIREQARIPFVVDIVGRGGAEHLRDLACPNLNLIGEVPQVGLYYEASDAVIVPLRAGGGTRIKILEAFSYGRPVVTTSIGVEGLDALPDEHILVADTPETFAAACLQLMSDTALRQHLVEKATALLRQSYTLEGLKETVRCESFD